uniref:(northern house mosquito) hypothetical protein n=1 Tax=Culex pipiens TaxID=7175 RepID=A0A8D8MLI5_CULPI
MMFVKTTSHPPSTGSQLGLDSKPKKKQNHSDHPLLSCISSRKTKNCKICSFTAHDRAVCASMIRSCSTPLNPYLLEVLALVEWELTMESTPSTRSPTVNPAWRKTST